MVRVRKRVTEGRFTARAGRRRRRSRPHDDAVFDDESGAHSNPKLSVPDAVEQSLLTLDAAKDFQRDAPGQKGWRDVVFGWLKKSPPPKAGGRFADGDDDDPVRDILSHARGPARLDAFQKTLERLVAGTAGHRGVAIAFHRELIGLAEQAQVDLALLKVRVEACAKGLMAAGEPEVAGMLLARIGRRHQAAEMFVAAGAIEALEKAHEEIERLESGARLDARLCYERFEGLFLVGMRHEALKALTQACTLWPENAIYDEIRDRFELRLPNPLGVLLKAKDSRVLVRRKWPLTVGRDANAALTLKSPLVSRQHLEFASTPQGVRVLPIEVPSETLVDGEPLTGPRDLPLGTGSIDIRGVVVNYSLTATGLLLWAQHGEVPRLFAPLTSSFVVNVGETAVPLVLDADDRLVLPAEAHLKLGGDRLKRPMLVLCEDKILVDHTPVDVLRP